MEIIRLFKAVWKYRRMILLMALSAALNSALITYMISEKYEATAMMLIKPRQDINLGASDSTKDVLNFPTPVSAPFEAMAQTYSALATSPATAERLVRTLHLDAIAAEHRWWKRLINDTKKTAGEVWSYLKYGRLEKGDPKEKAVEEVLRNLKVEPTRGTYVFEVKYTAGDGEQAATVANETAKILLEYNDESKRSEAKGTRAFLEDRLRQSAEKIQRARRALQQFKERNQIVLLDKEVSAKIVALYDFQTYLANTQKDAEGTKAEIAETQKQLKDQGVFIKSSFKMTDNPLVTELSSELAKLEIDLSGLQKKLGARHPDVIALEAKIEKASSRLRQEVGQIMSEETSALNTVHQKLMMDLVAAETKLQGLLAREKNLLTMVTRQDAGLKGYPSLQAQLARLELDLSVSEDAYKLIQTEYQDASIREAVSISEISLVSAATVPTYPKKPIKIYYAGMGLVMALGLGVVLALFIEYLIAEPVETDTEGRPRGSS